MNPDPFEAYLQGRGKLTAEEEKMALVGAVRHLKSENDHLKTLFEGAKRQVLMQGAVVAVRGDQTLLATSENGLLSVMTPRHLLRAPVPGELVWAEQDGKIIFIEPKPPAIGPTMKVSRIVEQGLAEVHGDDLADRIVVFKGDAKPGDLVLLDGSRSVIACNLGQTQKVSELAFTEETGIGWDDIAGQEDAKRMLREAIEGPILHPDVYKAFGKSPCKGILLFGPPGTGKTLFARAIATEIQKRKGGRSSGFIYVKGPEVLQGIVGQSEGKVRKIFAAARDHCALHGYAAVVCIDEADAILGKRTDSKISMEKTIVPQFLAEMDGIDPSGALCILLTNRPDTLDPAVTRDGRIDLKVAIPRPTKEDSVAIVSYHLGKRLLAPGLEREALAKATADGIFSPRHVMYMVRMLPGRGMDTRVGLDRFVSGALCAGVVDRATVRAIRRHLAGDEPKGITAEDLDLAVKETPAQIKALAHGEELNAVVDDFGGRSNVKSIEPV